MHILYLHQHFALPSGSSGTRSYEFAKRWVKAGHKVTVITGHFDIGGLEYSREPQVIDGINIIIAGMPYGNKMNFIKRILSFLSFIFFAFVSGVKVRGVDVVFATSTPLTIGIPGIWLKKFKRVPMVFEVRDEWPQIPIDMGYLKNHLLIRILYSMEKHIYKESSAIVALSPGMKEGIIKRLNGIRKQIIVASNSSDLERFFIRNDRDKIRKILEWKDNFVLLHFGAMGKANDLEFLLDAAENLKEYSDIKFVLIGGGSEKEGLIKNLHDLKIKNVDILDSLPKEELPKIVSAADVSMVIFANYSILEHNSANKFFDSLSSGKPILLNYSGWHRDLIEKVGAGYGVAQDDLDSFCENVLKLYKVKSDLTKFQISARKLAEEKFSRDIISNTVLDTIIGAYNDNSVK